MVIDSLDRKFERNSPVPLYYQLKNLLLEAITAKGVKKGESIPTEKEICEYYKISRVTVRQAIMELVQEGYLQRTKGKGTFVSDKKFERGLENKSFSQQMHDKGKIVKNEIIKLENSLLDKSIAKKMRISVGTEVQVLIRKRYIDEEPISYTISYINIQDKEKITLLELGETGSMWDALAKRDLEIYSVEYEIEAILATKKIAEILEIKDKAAVLFLEVLTCDKEQNAIEFSYVYTRGDKGRYHGISKK